MLSDEQRDIDKLRRAIRRCLRAEMPTHSSTLADMQTRYAKGEQRLRSPSSTYAIESNGKIVERVKPAHGQWATTTHATATRPPGYSRETIKESDFSLSRYARVVYSLSPDYITSIRAHYAPGRSVRHAERSRLSTMIANGYRTPETKARAWVIAMSVLTGRDSARKLREAFGMDAEEWRNSRVRRMLTDIRASLAALDADALRSWDDQCLALDEAPQSGTLDGTNS